VGLPYRFTPVFDQVAITVRLLKSEIMSSHPAVAVVAAMARSVAMVPLVAEGEVTTLPLLVAPL
jgi:hypothetical protein